MTDAQKREAARNFINKWKDKGKEDEDARSFWIDILQNILGVQDATDRMEFEKKVVGADGNTKRIDVYIPETKVLIEQKSLGIDLSKPQAGHGGKTPYEQAKDYDNQLPHSQKARWIIVSNFSEIRIYDMDARVPEPAVLLTAELQNKYTKLDFLIDSEQTLRPDETEVSVKAGELVGKIYDALLKEYIDPESERALKSLNMLCVRLVFCLYAEDAGIFGKKNMFHDYLAAFEAKDIRKALIELFKTLDTKLEDRDPYDKSALAEFPYVNGGLFEEENIEIPNFTEEIKTILLAKASDDFDWSKISPTIFGAVFESTLNPETRRSGGMHYTSVENIHKVIDPLFLDELKDELSELKKIAVTKTRETKLKDFQKKLASLKWFDPACGSGNFLTETYISIRRLENEILEELGHGQIVMGDIVSPIEVSIAQFYGIEINDFAVTVAKTALWIAESQMLKETEDIVHLTIDFLPLKTNANISEGNALTTDWETIVPKEELNYIMGNPPFVGASMMSARQKDEAVAIFGKIKLSNSIDYVGAWYHKAAKLTHKTNIKTAFVSTNSITQGEQVAPLWKKILTEYEMKIDFAYRTFKWNSEANDKAAVHCVIIGISAKTVKAKKIIYDGENTLEAENISPYLINTPDVLVESTSKPICSVPRLTNGNKPTDDGNFILSEQEKDDLLQKDQSVEQCIRRYIGAKDFLNNNEIRYCLWLKGINPTVYKNNREIMQRLDNIRAFREKSSAAPTRKSAERPYLFFSATHTDEEYIIIPSVSSKRRRYIPMGFMNPMNIASNLCLIIPNATLYHFGVLTSNVHMSWMRAVCGRLKSDYRYSGGIVYNTFPWAEVSDKQREKITQTAQGILDARALYPTSSLAALYDPLTMPPELLKAHQANDRAVMEAYGFNVKTMSEADCVAALMRRYQELTAK